MQSLTLDLLLNILFGSNIYATTLDLTKAFDRISHSVPLIKLRAIRSSRYYYVCVLVSTTFTYVVWQVFRPTYSVLKVA